MKAHREIIIDDNGPRSGNIVRAEIYINGLHFAEILDPEMQSVRMSEKTFATYLAAIKSALEQV